MILVRVVYIISNVLEIFVYCFHICGSKMKMNEWSQREQLEEVQPSTQRVGVASWQFQ